MMDHAELTMTSTSEAAAREAAAKVQVVRTGVTGVCSGPEMTAGKLTGRAAVVFFVQRKRDVPAPERIPKEIGGVPTDVVEWDPQPLTMSLGSPPPPRVRPIRPGVGIGLQGTLGMGTLGMMFLYDGQVMALTARHVLEDGTQPIVQPAMSRHDSDIVGSVDEADATLDAAAIRLAVTTPSEPKLRTAFRNCAAFDAARQAAGGPEHSVYLHPFSTYDVEPAWWPRKRWTAIAPAKRGDPVAKIGARTAYTQGYVFADDLQVVMRYAYGTYTMRNTLAIYSSNEKPFAVQGDSGATVFAATGRISTAHATVIAGQGRMSVAVPMETQLEAMFGKGCVAR
jgi:hypothetical protein